MTIIIINLLGCIAILRT